MRNNSEKKSGLTALFCEIKESDLDLPLPLGEVAERSEDGEGSQEVVKRLILLDFEILKRYRYSDIIQIYNKAKKNRNPDLQRGGKCLKYYITVRKT